MLAPTVNSYKRLIRRGAMSYYSWAPVFNSYGANNRTNSVRVPAGGVKIVEFQVVPYGAHAAPVDVRIDAESGGHTVASAGTAVHV